jgi:hypothetical protein
MRPPTHRGFFIPRTAPAHSDNADKDKRGASALALNYWCQIETRTDWLKEARAQSGGG